MGCDLNAGVDPHFDELMEWVGAGQESCLFPVQAFAPARARQAPATQPDRSPNIQIAG
jgi:hypothetical protein